MSRKHPLLIGSGDFFLWGNFGMTNGRQMLSHPGGFTERNRVHRILGNSFLQWMRKEKLTIYELCKGDKIYS